MSEKVDVVRAALDAFNRGDFDAMLRYAAPDFELDWSRAVGPQRGVYKLDQARSFFDDFGDTFESIRVEPNEFIEVDDGVIVPQTGYTRGRDGIETTARITLIWTIRDGAIVRICLYQDKQDALQAAGLSE
jgi:ketosteroid isomerase-like protein